MQAMRVAAAWLTNMCVLRCLGDTRRRHLPWAKSWACSGRHPVVDRLHTSAKHAGCVARLAQARRTRLKAVNDNDLAGLHPVRVQEAKLVTRRLWLQCNWNGRNTWACGRHCSLTPNWRVKDWTPRGKIWREHKSEIWQTFANKT